MLTDILLNTFRRMRLKFENYTLSRMTFITLHSENKSLIESFKSCLGHKEQNAMVLVVSRSDLHFGFEHPFFPLLIGRTSNITRRRVGRLERKTKFSQHKVWKYLQHYIQEHQQ